MKNRKWLKIYTEIGNIEVGIESKDKNRITIEIEDDNETVNSVAITLTEAEDLIRFIQNLIEDINQINK